LLFSAIDTYLLCLITFWEVMMALLRPAEVARLLNVSGSTVRRWIIDGHLPSIKTPGGQYRIDPRTLDEWMARLDQGRTPEPEAA
jgi:excisionase family DNA binding protein